MSFCDFQPNRLLLQYRQITEDESRKCQFLWSGINARQICSADAQRCADRRLSTFSGTGIRETNFYSDRWLSCDGD